MIKQILNWKWVKSSLEGANQTASSRRLTTFWFVVLSTLNTVGILIGAYLITTKAGISDNKSIEALDRLINLQIILNLMVLLLSAIITIDKVNDIVRSVKGLPQAPLEVKTTTETTSVVTPQ